MKRIYILSAIILAACSNNDRKTEARVNTDTVKVIAESTPKIDTKKQTIPLPSGKIYSNERFKEVTAKETGDHIFLIQGKAQIFEASFSWVVEDGHDELKKGFQMTDAGAPEWGNFSFIIDIQKKRANSTLTLILFESSPKDGSRQHELSVVLY